MVVDTMCSFNLLRYGIGEAKEQHIPIEVDDVTVFSLSRIDGAGLYIINMHLIGNELR